jgi:hypothetical protein
MTRALALALALALVLVPRAPTPAQEAAPADPPGLAEASASTEAAIPDPVSDPAADPALDPLAAWEADRTLVLPAAGLDLAAFAYLARPLVVFADSPRQPQFLEQMRLIEAGLGDLARRDVAVIVDTDPGARSAVRAALRPRGFGVVLLDMDGRVLLRRPDPTDAREIGRTIDRSPLRQEELRGGRAQGSTN